MIRPRDVRPGSHPAASPPDPSPQGGLGAPGSRADDRAPIPAPPDPDAQRPHGAAGLAAQAGAFGALAIGLAATAGWTWLELGLGRSLPAGAAESSLFALTMLRHSIEVLGVGYAVCFVLAALRYASRRRRALPSGSLEKPPAVAVVYLCCGDLDERALESLTRLHYPGRLVHILHDDASSLEENRRVDELVKRLGSRTGVAWRVLRRPAKGGGKPGALQYVFDRTADDYEFFLLADNDSEAPDPELLAKVIPSFSRPEVAAVQLRNRARVVGADGAFAVAVAPAIDMFDAFMTGLFEALWRPFVGHNAVLRTRAVKEAGGFTPGVFADDIDLTVRMNLRGQRVLYRPDLCMGETHPANYRSFCLRSEKWARGCAQVLRAHLSRVLASRIMTLREKLGFLLFTGFYVAQAAMLAYMLLVFVVLPLCFGATWTAAPWAFVVGTLVPLSIFLPVAAYLLTEGRGLPFFRTLAACAATYGSTDLWTVIGLATGFRKKPVDWVPTNGVAKLRRPWLDWTHFVFGCGCLLVPFWFQPQLLLFPLTWVFAAKYLFVPAVSAHYGAAPEPARSSALALRSARCLAPFGLLGALLLPSPAPAVAARTSGEGQARVELRGGRILVDGRPALIRGIHYSPWRAGTGPGRGFPYPSDAEIAEDLELIRALHANTILVYDAPARLLHLASRYGLDVIYSFDIRWWRLANAERETIAGEIAGRVREVRAEPSVIAWMLGNEVPGWVIDTLRPEGVRDALASFRAAIREVDSSRPVCHGNWPLTRTLELDASMDLLCYNVYPFFPPEVPISGYGRFIEEEIASRARGRPLLVTEFGANTREATPEEQVDILRRCWQGLLDAGAQGGVLFEFADEWWKNYDNPVQPPDWWRRVDAPEDHLSADPDPEEAYGIVTADRVPKPAYAATREMFAASAGSAAWLGAVGPRVLWWIGGIAALGTISSALWLRWQGGRRTARLPVPACGPSTPESS